MNGELHSEHVISKSGIAVSPRERTEDIHSLALRSAGVAFLSTTGLWDESAFSQTLRRKAGVPTGFLGLSLPQQISVFKQLFAKTVAVFLHAVQPVVALPPHGTLISPANHPARVLLPFLPNVVTIK